MAEGDTGQQNTGGQGGTPGQAGDQQDGQQNQNNAPVTFDSWITSQDEQVKTLVNGHITGLKSALDSEREARKSFETQLRDAAKKAEKGSESEQRLTQMADQLAGAERQAKFYELANAAGVTNLRLAWIAAQEAKLIDGQGNVNIETMKGQFPELFKGPPAPKGNAGSGAGQVGSAAPNMNTFIRQAAGYS